MHRIVPLFLLLALTLASCTTKYYLVVSKTETPIYDAKDSNKPMTVVPANMAFLYGSRTMQLNTKYGSYNGHSLYSDTWRRLAKLNKKQVRSLKFTSDKGYTYSGISSSLYGSSTYGSKSSTSASSGGTVNVKGYTRKNGTYVQPHTRSAPRGH